MNIKSEKSPDIWIVLFFFIFTLIAGLFVQLVILPYVFPAWNAGEGLLVGGDWIRFHSLAVSLAEKIKAQGWSVWTLTPGGQPVSGIAALFYALITPKPWAVLPLNALLHAVSGWILFRIAFLFLREWKKAFIVSLPFVIFPSALTWTSQMHNDSYSILGSYLFVFGWILLIRSEKKNQWKSLLLGLIFTVIGGLLVGIVRSYLSQILQVVACFFLLLYTLRWLVELLRNRKATWFPLVVLVLMIGSTIAISPSKKVTMILLPQSSQVNWSRTPWLPSPIDSQLHNISEIRYKNIIQWGGAASNIDTDINFYQAIDYLKYLPRATEIAFLAPFPSDWLGTGRQEANTLMRRISGVEMIIGYITFLMLPIALWKGRKQLEEWIFFIFCFCLLILFTLATPNVGTLYRFRYGYWMGMMMLGLCGWFMMINTKGRKEGNNQ